MWTEVEATRQHVYYLLGGNLRKKMFFNIVRERMFTVLKKNYLQDFHRVCF